MTGYKDKEETDLQEECVVLEEVCPSARILPLPVLFPHNFTSPSAACLARIKYTGFGV